MSSVSPVLESSSTPPSPAPPVSPEGPSGGSPARTDPIQGSEPAPKSTVTLLRRPPTELAGSQLGSPGAQPPRTRVLLSSHLDHGAPENPQGLDKADSNQQRPQIALPNQPLSSSDHNQELPPLALTGLARCTDSLDTTVVEAMMTGTVRDKQILLQAEAEMGRFVSSSQLRHPLGSALSTSLNSYQRMLVHRLGDSFGIKRSMEMGNMIMERTPQSAMPAIRLESFIVRQDASPSNAAPSAPPTGDSPATTATIPGDNNPIASASPQTVDEASTGTLTPSTAPLKAFKIMSRTPSQRSSSRQTNVKGFTASSGSSVSSTDANNSDTKRNELSFEARQAAYLQARNRIFASDALDGTESPSGPLGPDGIAQAPSEKDASKTINGLAGESAEASQSIATLNGKDEPPMRDGTAVASLATKGKERMAANLRSAKLAAKLRPGATTFDPNAKAHGYEEVTIIDFDRINAPIPWPGHEGYPYPSVHNARHFHNSRQSRPGGGQLYGDGFPNTIPFQHYPPCGLPPNGDQRHPYSPFPSSNGHQAAYAASQPFPGPASLAPYQQAPSFNGPVPTDQTFVQDSGSRGPHPSNANARSFNTNMSIQPIHQASGQHGRFQDPPFQSSYGANGIQHMVPHDPTMNGAQPFFGQERTVGSRATRPQFGSLEQNSIGSQLADPRVSSAQASMQAKPGLQGAQPTSELHQSINYSQPSVPYHMPQGANTLPQHHMNQYHCHPQGATHTSPFDNNLHPPGPPITVWPQPPPAPQQFQPPIQVSTINQPVTSHETEQQSSASSPRHSFHHPVYANNQQHPAVSPNLQQTYPSVLPSRSHDYSSAVDSRMQMSGNQAPQIPQSTGSCNFQPASTNSLQLVARKHDTGSHPHQFSSSMSCSSTDSHRTAASCLSRSMSNMKLVGGTNDAKLMRQNSRPANTRIMAADTNLGRYPRSPTSVGSSTSSHKPPTRPGLKNGTSSSDGGHGQPDEAGSIHSFQSEQESKVSNQTVDTVDVGSLPSSSKAEISLAPHTVTGTVKKAKNSGSANSNTSSDALSTNSSEHLPALQHPLPPKPLWATTANVTVKAPSAKSSGKSSASSGGWNPNPPASSHYAVYPTQPSLSFSGPDQPHPHYNHGDQNRGISSVETPAQHQAVHNHTFQQQNHGGYGPHQPPPPAPPSQMLWHHPPNLSNSTLPSSNGYSYNNIHNESKLPTVPFNNGGSSPYPLSNPQPSNSTRPTQSWATQAQCRTQD